MKLDWSESKWPELLVADFSFSGGLSPEDINAIIENEWETEPDDKELSRNDALMMEMNRIGIRTGIFAQGSDYLEKINAPEKVKKAFQESETENIAKMAAARLGLPDYRPLMLSTRTKEQESFMAGIGAEMERIRTASYITTNYHHAIVVVEFCFTEILNATSATSDKKSRFLDPFLLTAREDWETDISPTISFLVRYFFALHGRLREEGVAEIDPTDTNNLTEAQEQELTDLAKKLAAYRKRHNGGFYENISACFQLQSVAADHILTEFAKRDDIFLPVSKAWRESHIVASKGKKGYRFGVGGNAKITVTISDKDGNPLQLDGIRDGAQMAIGNLIDNPANHGNLPILVSPDQVYREWAGLASDVDVSDAQAAEMEAAMDSVIFAPSKMDFTEQLEKHKVKKASDYDYKGKNAGRLSGTLIPATKIEAFRKDGSRTVAYKVYDYPMLYLYSHVVGHMATVKRDLITGGKNKPAVEKGKGAQYNSRDVSMRHNVLTRVERMKSDKKESRRVLLSQIMEDLLIEPTDKTERTLKKNLEIYLSELKTQKEIKNFLPVMGGRANRKFLGFEIIP